MSICLEGRMWGRPVWARWTEGEVAGDELLLDVAALSGGAAVDTAADFLRSISLWLDSGTAELRQESRPARARFAGSRSR